MSTPIFDSTIEKNDSADDFDHIKMAARLKTSKKRRKRYIAPLFFAALEIGIVWILISIFNLTFNITEWVVIATAILFVASLRILYRMLGIYERSKNYPSVHEVDAID